MLITSRHDDTHWALHFVGVPCVLLDGVEQKHVTQAYQHERHGWVEKHVIDESGNPKIQDDAFVLSKTYGKVEIIGERRGA